MILLPLLASLLMATGSFAQKSSSLITMPEVLYVMPGDDFTIVCSSSEAVSAKIFVPGERLLSEQQKMRIAANDPFRKDMSTSANLKDASKEKHEGIYTCLVSHGLNFDGPQYSEATCRVIIVDICAESDCTVLETCVPDQNTGTYQCVCEFTCPRDFVPICADTCDFHYNECAMDEESCIDGLLRSKWLDGFCPEIVPPTVRKAIDVQQYEEDEGTKITMSTGLIDNGYPEAVIQWTFKGEVIEGETGDLEIVVSDSTAGKYSCIITQCRDDIRAIVNQYEVRVSATPTTVPPPGRYFFPKPTCTIYPGGGVETFASTVSLYDLSCNHVLAADLGSDQSLGQDGFWFIYGVFDNFQGQVSLKSMTFYVGRSMWEVTRGWLVHINGEKLSLKETGVEQVLPGVGCSATFENWHLKVDCPNFEVYYDGIMAGHIALKRSSPTENLVQKNDGTEIGLCFGAESSWRPNWQVGSSSGECSVDPDKGECSTGSTSCPSHISQDEEEICGLGGAISCGELTCDGNLPTDMQNCSLDQATAFSCALKNGIDIAQVAGASCPRKECDWFLSVVDEGCPQTTFPFQCGETDSN